MNFRPASAGDKSTFSRWRREEVFLCPDFGKNLTA
jgi:hypothetical protein